MLVRYSHMMSLWFQIDVGMVLECMASLAYPLPVISCDIVLAVTNRIFL